jgi:hypothetical protein
MFRGPMIVNTGSSKAFGCNMNYEFLPPVIDGLRERGMAVAVLVGFLSGVHNRPLAVTCDVPTTTKKEREEQ